MLAVVVSTEHESAERSRANPRTIALCHGGGGQLLLLPVLCMLSIRGTRTCSLRAHARGEGVVGTEAWRYGGMEVWSTGSTGSTEMWIRRHGVRGIAQEVAHDSTCRAQCRNGSTVLAVVQMLCAACCSGIRDAVEMVIRMFWRCARNGGRNGGRGNGGMGYPVRGRARALLALS